MVNASKDNFLHITVKNSFFFNPSISNNNEANNIINGLNNIKK